MAISDTDIKQVARLARLKIDEQSVSQVASDLDKILVLFEQINQAETDGINPMAHPLTEMTQRLREDEVTENIDRAVFQTQAPSTEEGLYLVPKVIDDNT